MSSKKSYLTQKRKIFKTWERSEENEDNLDNIPLTSINFDSINFNKKTNTFSIIAKQQFNAGDHNITNILLEDFPEWALNFITVHEIISFEDAYTAFPITYQLGNFFGSLGANGTIGITVDEFNYWFNKIDDKNFLLKIFSRKSIRQEGGTIVPFFIDLSLKIYNERIYEVANEKFK